MILSSIPDFSLQHDEALGLLRVEWAAGNDMRGLRASTARLFDLCRELGTTHWLLNMNSFPDISVYDQVWLGSQWLPGLTTLPLERVVLVIHRSRVHNQLAIDALLVLARPFLRFDVQFFMQSETGLQWLCDKSGRLPALLAEWNAVHGPDLPAAPNGLNEPESFYRSRY